MAVNSDDSDVEGSEDDEPVAVAASATGGGSSSTDKGPAIAKEVFILVDRIERQ